MHTATLTVYHLPGGWGLPSVSPFCLKLDAIVRLMGLDHQTRTTATPFGGPKRKAPWIEHGGRTIGDSSFIVAYLIEQFGRDPDAHLTPAERGQAVAIQRLVEENLYWAMVHDRWERPENGPILKGSVLGRVAPPLRAVLAPLARRAVRAQLRGHGMGLHSDADIAAIARRDLDALDAMVHGRMWFLGTQPPSADAAVYSLLANIRDTGFASPMKAMIAQRPALGAFIDRFRERVYG